MSNRFAHIYLLFVVFTVFAVFGATADGWAARKRVPATQRIMEVLTKIQENMQVTEYRHRTKVRVKKGEYRFDCSGMAKFAFL